MQHILSFMNFNYPESDDYDITILEEDIPQDKEFSIVLYNLDTVIDFEDIRGNLANNNIYRISILDDESDKPAFESFKTHAWIYKESLNELPKLIDTIIENRYIEAVAI